MVKSTRLGLMSGFLAMMFITLLYLVDPTLLVDGYERLTLLLFAGAIIYGVQQERQTKLSVKKIEELVEQDTATTDENDEVSDFAPFGELLQLGFRTYVIAYFMKFAFIYFLFNYYDPSLIELVKDASVEVYMEHQDFSKDTEEIIQQKIARYKEGNFGPSLKDVLGIGLELILGFIIAFLTALFFKREQPDY
ncbi:DUF4199 domain-containing protein [Aureispira anguillae]|uniref:DUF4199 domain-containing protein n=1 Tax=Aureispira anguillae TaxID=2864201 RepID=A0A915YG79_9BACT|nr:DUF4199 domain-containing protein [Aureispira anguillae]BDS12568.1 DUF4199 domain-containing protein [Aureispira anguillae]